MNAPRNFEDAPQFADEELVALQLRVARRADELAPKNSHDRSTDLEHWLQAERELLSVSTELSTDAPSDAALQER